MAFSWQMAEQLAATHMREIGFLDAQTTRSGSDGGLDVIATGAAAQVKYLGSPVGSPDVQRLRGAAHGVDNALFYSFSGYSRSAVDIAEASGVALFRFSETNNVWPENGLAVKLSNLSPEHRWAAIKRVGGLLRWSRSVTFALSDVLGGLKDGELPPWPEFQDDTELISTAVDEVIPQLSELNAALESFEVERALPLAQEFVDFAERVVARMAERPSAVAGAFAAAQEKHARQFEHDNELAMAEDD